MLNLRFKFKALKFFPNFFFLFFGLHSTEIHTSLLLHCLSLYGTGVLEFGAQVDECQVQKTPLGTWFAPACNQGFLVV